MNYLGFRVVSYKPCSLMDGYHRLERTRSLCSYGGKFFCNRVNCLRDCTVSQTGIRNYGLLQTSNDLHHKLN
jgi:hypothetical protein